MRVPDRLTRSVRARWPNLVESWLANVGSEFEDLLRQHAATPEHVLPARYAFVVTAASPSGPLVFRATPDPAALRQAAVADALDQLGVGPTIHLSTSTETGSWTVMKRVIPGTPLADAEPRTLDVEALTRPLLAITGQPAPSHDLPCVADWLRDRLSDDQLSELPVSERVATKPERARALEVLDDLTSNMHSGLCHGDASPWNILADQSGRWMFIDPRGVRGEVEYDAAVMAYKLKHFLSIADAAARISRATGLDLDRIGAWETVARAARV